MITEQIGVLHLNCHFYKAFKFSNETYDTCCSGIEVRLQTLPAPPQTL